MRANDSTSPAYGNRRQRIVRSAGLLFGPLLLAGWMMAQTPATMPAPSAAPAGNGISLDQPRVTYSRSFKGSQPAFLQVIIGQDGKSEYQTRESDGQPEQSFFFTASPPTVSEVFQLAKRAGDFRKPLEDRHSKVSYMGTKMLSLDSPTEHHQQVFNFTRNQPAMALQQLFEKIADTGEHTLKLQQAMRYDRLGVVKELNLIRVDWDQQQMLEPAILLPTLQQISRDQNLMGIARNRAAELAREMTNPAAAPPKK